MHQDHIHLWQHRHTFGQEQKKPGEPRTLIVIGITATMMAVEVAAGILLGSMALLADGLHMASHAVALSINAFAYLYARRQAHNTDYSFGTGKVNALGGFTGALLLMLFALLMAGESFGRFTHPVPIIFDQAILVAVLGLVVNGVCAFVLSTGDHHEHGHPHSKHSHDHNLQSAYLHVMADALTSVLAIFALLAAKYAGLIWMDPAMGILGAILVSLWSVGLLRTTSGVLLDRQGPERIRRKIKDCIEGDNDSRITDLHLWSIAPNVYAAVIVILAHHPLSPNQYKARIPADLGLEHVSIEVQQCEQCENRMVGQGGDATATERKEDGVRPM